MSVDLSIAIVSYETREQILDCLRSVLEHTHRCTFEVIVVDNASTDGTVEAIRDVFPGVTVVASKENLGFAQANNVAARRAAGRRLLLLNPDTRLTDAAIDNLVAFADQHSDAGIWGGRTTFPDGTINPSCLGDITLWSTISRACGLTYLFPRSRFFNPESIHRWDPLDREREVDIVVGCFLLVDRSLWEALDGFDPDFFMYGEEVDFSLRARKRGARPRITPSATIIHYGGGSERSTEDKVVKILRGRITVMKVHWPRVSVLIGRWVLLATVALRAVASKIVRPPERRGGGLDGRVDLWGAVFRRRREWLGGWPTRSRRQAYQA